MPQNIITPIKQSSNHGGNINAPNATFIEATKCLFDVLPSIKVRIPIAGRLGI